MRLFSDSLSKAGNPTVSENSSLGTRRARTRRYASVLICCGALVFASLAWGQESDVPPLPPDDAPAKVSTAQVPLSPDEEPILIQAHRTLMIPPPIGGGIWLSQGPGPATSGQVEGITGGHVVGAVHTVAAHPTDPDTIYAGGVNGGVWKTTNATSVNPFWTPLTDFETSLSIGALEFDPTDGTHMTLIAGNNRYSSFGSSGGLLPGLLRTTDGGSSWAAIDGGVLGGTAISGVAPRGSTIVISSNFSEPVFACSAIGIWRSVNTGTTFTQISPLSVPPGPVGVAFDLSGDPASPGTLYTGMTFVSGCTAAAFTNGIYKSTDTGLTWTKVSSPAMDALIIDGTTNNIEIAADGLDVYVDIIQSGRPVGIFHSPDGGSTWTAMDLPRTPEGAPLPIGLVTPGAPVTIDTTPTPHGFAGLSEEVEIMGVVGPAINGVWTTTVTSAFTFDLVGSADFTPWAPATGAWVKVVGLSPKQKAGSQGGIHASIRPDPASPDIVYLGGDRQDSPFPNFILAGNFTGRLFRGDTTVTPTGGIPSPQWEHMTHSDLIAAIPGGGTASGSAPHADSREMVFDANGELIQGDDGGIYRRTSPIDNTGDWFSLNNNLHVTEQHDVAYDAVSDIIISGNQDIGTTQQSSTSSLVWDSIHTGDGGDVAVDDLTSAVMSTRYSSFQNFSSFRRREYDTANGFLSQVFPTLTPLGAVSLIPVFVTPIELNEVAPTHMVIAGCNSVFESFDKGDTYVEIPGLFDSDCSPSILSFVQNAMAYGGFAGAVPDPDALWVGSGASVFNRLAPPGAPLIPTLAAFPAGAGETVTDIVLDPTATSTAYVLDQTSVFQTHDAGATWTDITGNITDTQLRAAEIDVGPPGRIFVGGREGVFELPLPPPGVPAVGPFVWGELGTGLPNAPVWDLEWDPIDGVLLVGTLGRGAWTLQENGTCGFPKNLTVRNQNVSTTTTFKGCNTIFAGPALTVDATVDFVAGVSITFGNGTILDGTVEVEIDPALISP